MWVLTAQKESYNFSGNVGSEDNRQEMLAKIQEDIQEENKEFEVKQDKLYMEIRLYENILGL